MDDVDKDDGDIIVEQPPAEVRLTAETPVVRVTEHIVLTPAAADVGISS